MQNQSTRVVVNLTPLIDDVLSSLASAHPSTLIFSVLQLLNLAGEPSGVTKFYASENLSIFFHGNKKN